MVHSRHPDIATRLVVQLVGHPTTPCLAAAADTARQLVGIRGFEPPSWRALLSARPPPRNIDDFEPGSRRPGWQWQHEASSRTAQQFRDMLFAARMSPSAQATIRSQRWTRSGHGSDDVPDLPHHNHPATALPQSPSFVVSVFLFTWPCVPAGVAAHSMNLAITVQLAHRAGVLGKRGWALENVAARICREAGGRVSTNILMRNLDLARPDVRRWSKARSPR